MKYLIVNQTYYPDKAATAQYLTDLAEYLAEQGHSVSVLTSRRSYFDRTLLHEAQELVQGVYVERVVSPFFSERKRLGRVLNAFLLNIALALRFLRMGDHQVVIACTSPPLLGWFISCANKFKRSRLVLFVMDLNPDQAITAGWIPSTGLITKLLQRAWSSALRRASTVLCLDNSMRHRILNYEVDSSKVHTVDLWWKVDEQNQAKGNENIFRIRHQLQDKFVILYAGNHSLCHPLDTFLEAASLLSDRKEIVFVFVGGGPRVQDVYEFKRRHSLTNLLQLPYQKREDLADILSAADLHLVSLGNNYNGIVHPCKFYSALGVNRRIVVLSPASSYLANYARISSCILHFEHGQSVALSEAIRVLLDGDKSTEFDDGYVELRERFSSSQAMRSFLGRLYSECHNAEAESFRIVNSTSELKILDGSRRSVPPAR